MIAKGLQYGYQGIEWWTETGHQHGVELDVPASQIHAIRNQVADDGLETSCLATSIK